MKFEYGCSLKGCRLFLKLAIIETKEKYIPSGLSPKKFEFQFLAENQVLDQDSWVHIQQRMWSAPVFSESGSAKFFSYLVLFALCRWYTRRPWAWWRREQGAFLWNSGAIWRGKRKQAFLLSCKWVFCVEDFQHGTLSPNVYILNSLCSVFSMFLLWMQRSRQN
jgi:hypothetical protein